MFAGEDDLYPPVQYGWGWLALAVGIIALGIVVAVLVIWLTRPRYSLTREAAGEAPVQTAELLDALRLEYLGRLQTVEDEVRSGRLRARAAHLRLSREVRRFVQDYSGIEAPVLTLTELVERGVHPALVDAVARHYYPGVFRQRDEIDPLEGVEAGRRVVMMWY